MAYFGKNRGISIIGFKSQFRLTHKLKVFFTNGKFRAAKLMGTKREFSPSKTIQTSKM